MRDVKLMISSHAHHDHIGGHALMKEVTGATVLATAADAEVIETGGEADFRDSGLWKPAKVDRTIQDGEEIRLGGTVLTAHLTPGHTKGCTTWTMVAEEDGQKYNVVFVCGMRVNTGLPCRESNISEQRGRFYQLLCGTEELALRRLPRSARILVWDTGKAPTPEAGRQREIRLLIRKDTVLISMNTRAPFSINYAASAGHAEPIMRAT